MTVYELTVPHAVLSRNLNEIRFRYEFAVSPREIGLSDDPRRLAVQFDQVDFIQQ